MRTHRLEKEEDVVSTAWFTTKYDEIYIGGTIYWGVVVFEYPWLIDDKL